MKITKLLLLSLLIAQAGCISGMQLSDMPMDIMRFIVRDVMWIDVESTDNNQKSKICKKHILDAEIMAIYNMWPDALFEQNERSGQNGVWHTIKRNHALQLVSKNLRRIFWSCFALPEFTLQERDIFIASLLCMWNTNDFQIKPRSEYPMPPIAEIAVNMQASLYVVLYKAISSQKCNLEFVRVILTSDNADEVINRTLYGFTPLSLAVIHGHLEVVKLLLLHPAIDVNDTHPLYRAVDHGQLEMVKLLLAHPQVKVNAKRYNGETALFACINRYSNSYLYLAPSRSLLDLLINAGADSALKNKKGETVLDVARGMPNLQSEVLEIFEQVFAEKK